MGKTLMVDSGLLTDLEHMFDTLINSVTDEPNSDVYGEKRRGLTLFRDLSRRELLSKTRAFVNSRLIKHGISKEEINGYN